MYSKQYFLVKTCFSLLPSPLFFHPSSLHIILERLAWVYPNIQITLSHFIRAIHPIHFFIVSRDFSCLLSFKHPFVDVRGIVWLKNALRRIKNP